MEVQIQIENLEQVREKLRELAIKRTQRAPIILKQAGMLMAGYCKSFCPVGVSGRLRASIGSPNNEGILESSATEMKMGTAVSYAIMVEDGSKAHDIYPKIKRALHWNPRLATKVSFTSTSTKRGASLYSGKGGKLVSKKESVGFFAKHVHHPGFKGAHYMLQGAEQSIPAIIDLMSTELAKGIMI